MESAEMDTLPARLESIVIARMECAIPSSSPQTGYILNMNFNVKFLVILPLKFPNILHLQLHMYQEWEGQILTPFPLIHSGGSQIFSYCGQNQLNLLDI